MSSKKNTVGTIIIIIILAAAIFGAYFFAKKMADERAKKKAEQEAQPTEVSLILQIDIANKYPETVRSVLKLYGRIIAGIHNETLEEGQLSGLQMQLRKLFDDELLEQNPIPVHLAALKSEVDEYDLKGRTIADCLVDSANNAEYSTVDGKKYCRMLVKFVLKEKSYVVDSYEEFVLRQDQDGKWKILGWRLVDKNGLPVINNDSNEAEK